MQVQQRPPLAAGADSPFAEDHVTLLPGQQGLRRHQPLLHARGRGAFHDHGLLEAARDFQERLILHVAGRDLDAIDVIGHLLGRPRIDDFGDHRESCLFAHAVQGVQPFIADPAEVVGTDPLRPQARPECVSARLLHRAGDLQGPGLGLDAARTGDHDRFPTPHRHAADPDDRLRRVDLAADQLERLGDGDAAGDPGKPDQERRIHRTPIPGNADRGPVRTRHPQRGETHVTDRGFHPPALFFGGVRPHDDQHD